MLGLFSAPLHCRWRDIATATFMVGCTKQNIRNTLLIEWHYAALHFLTMSWVTNGLRELS